jgi:hypothetical protein
MALGTVFSGNVKCDWCGNYIKNTDGGLTGAMGLDIVKRIGSAAMPHYCSKACKIAAQQAKEAGGGGNGGGGTTDTDAQVKQAQEQAEQKEIQNMRFDGSGDAIAADLSVLLARYNAIPTGLSAPIDAKKQKAAILEKMEFGLLKLRKIDSDTADYFQKKYDELTQKKPGLFGLGKK